jgi:hypothetical protein
MWYITECNAGTDYVTNYECTANQETLQCYGECKLITEWVEENFIKEVIAILEIEVSGVK